MNQGYFRRFAERCRQLMQHTRSEGAREQLSLWADEFDAHADTYDGKSNPGDATAGDRNPAPEALGAAPPPRDASR